jgi:acetylornithine deacetylase/succinyl-diaminopimelate desuccinylase-like protein
MQSANDYAQAQTGDFVRRLSDWLRIPSLSSLPEYATHMQRAAEWIAGELRQIGMTSVEIIPTDGHHIVYGAWTEAVDAPTVLFYGHYDVQPVGTDEDWISKPFEPTVRDNNLYARGATDDKGQLFANIKAVDSLMQVGKGKLPLNVKFLIEGEEEIGSPNLDHFIKTHKRQLKADMVVISDGSILAVDRPSICYGLRGAVVIDVQIHGPSHDLHSGEFGGAVDNPIHVLSSIIAQLHTVDNRVAIPGFYDKVLQVDKDERSLLNKVSLTEEALRRHTGVSQAWGEQTYTITERISIRPTLDVTTFNAGTGGGIIPAAASARISCRLVPDQNPQEIVVLLCDHIKSLMPPTVTYQIQEVFRAFPTVVATDTPEIRAAMAAYERVFGTKPELVREGGSLPVVASIQRELDIPVLLMGYGLPDDNMHSPNEKFNLICFERGIATTIALLESLSTQARYE